MSTKDIDFEAELRKDIVFATPIRVDTFAEHWVVRLAEKEINRVFDCNEDGDYFELTGWKVVGTIERGLYGYTVIEMPRVPRAPLVEAR